MLEVISAIIVAVSGIVTAYLSYKNKKDSDLQKQLNKDKEVFIREKLKETEDILIKAMETDITAVPLLRKKLTYYRNQLKKYIIFLLSCLFLTSCGTSKQDMIIGERIFKPNVGDVITVPALKTPAKQWYLIDDKAMLEILGVEKPVTPETIIGVQK